jgi:hypothetical protein
MNLRLTDFSACEPAGDVAAGTIAGPANAMDHGRSCVTAWQFDEKSTQWRGESGAGCGCGCGPFERLPVPA